MKTYNKKPITYHCNIFESRKKVAAIAAITAYTQMQDMKQEKIDIEPS